tara:strand:+ start:218 stop:502 length:285 start_codon:yes stop_codon:yes gene_type:complete
MGYIKFGKVATTNGGRADLIPCDDVMHVSVPTSTGVVLTFGENTAVDTATLVYPTQSDFSTIRDAINDAIELGNGASGPAITVDMVDITSITIA